MLAQLVPCFNLLNTVQFDGSQVQISKNIDKNRLKPVPYVKRTTSYFIQAVLSSLFQFLV